jgi:hypothetical protein
MDFDQIEKFGSVSTPKFHDPVKLASAMPSMGSTIEVGNFGDLFMVDENGSICYRNLRLTNNQDNDAHIQKLPIPGLTPESLKSFTSILSNREGNVLVLWSKLELGIIEIPSSFLKEGQLSDPNAVAKSAELSDANQCKFTSIYNRSSSVASSSLVKTAFHPLNPNTLVILHEKELLSLIDLRNYSKEEIYLPKHLLFTSFTFTNQSLEWFSFTIFLTTSTNEIYYLCPIIPSGTILSKAQLADILNWVQEEQEKLDLQLLSFSSTKLIEKRHIIIDEQKKFLKITINYLMKKFSKIALKEMMEKLKENPIFYQQAADETMAMTDRYIIAGGGSSPILSSNISYSLENQLFPERFEDEEIEEYDSSSNYRLALQGPIPVLRPSPTGLNNKNNNNQLSIQDICIPTIPSQNSGLIAPVLATVQSNGNVDLLLFDIVDENQWMIAPAWKTLDNPNPLQYLTIPQLIVTDNIQVSNAAANGKDVFQLVPDPGNKIKFCLILMVLFYFHLLISFSLLSLSVFGEQNERRSLFIYFHLVGGNDGHDE